MPKVAAGTELKDQHVVALMTRTESEAIETWMFANRIRSKGEAIRHLIAYALEQKSKEGGAA